MGELAEQPEEAFTHEYVVSLNFVTPSFTCPLRERREHKVFLQLLQTVPGIESRLFEGSDDDVSHIAELVRIVILVINGADIRQVAARLLYGKI